MTLYRPLVGLLALIILSISISCSDDSLTFQEGLAADQAAIMTFLQDEKITTKQDTIIGLHYRILEEGNDSIVEVDERINLTYSISHLGSNEVILADTSKTRLLSDILLAGMSVLVGYVEENGVIEMYLPSGYAFGGGSSDKLRANTPVVVTLRLNKIIKNNDEQFAYDQYLIDEYIAANNIEARIDSATGLKYVIVKPGDGFKPQQNSDVIVNYEGRIMLGGRLFDQGRNARFNLSGLIPGWQKLMPNIAEGGRIIMFIPSKYGYGDRRNIPSIDPYSILKFEVELLELPI